MTRYAPTLTPARDAWQHRAACLGEDPRIFDPAPGDVDTIDHARGICAACPVITQCLRAAIGEEGSVSAQHRACIRGGYTPEERVQIYRRYIAGRRARRVA